MFTDAEERAWLEGLKEGDAALVMQGSSWEHYLTQHTVTKTTPTQIVIGEFHFRRKGGGRVGDGPYSYSKIVAPTPDRLDIIKKRELLRYVEAVKWKACPTAVLEQVLAVVQAHYAEQAKADRAARESEEV